MLKCSFFSIFHSYYDLFFILQILLTYQYHYFEYYSINFKEVYKLFSYRWLNEFIVLVRQSKNEKECYNLAKYKWRLFVAASHQTGLDTRSKARRPIKVGIREREGWERVETRNLLVFAAHRLTWCNVSLMRQAVSRTQMWVRARILGYGLN